MAGGDTSAARRGAHQTQHFERRSWPSGRSGPSLGSPQQAPANEDGFSDKARSWWRAQRPAISPAARNACKAKRHAVAVAMIARGKRPPLSVTPTIPARFASPDSPSGSADTAERPTLIRDFPHLANKQVKITPAHHGRSARRFEAAVAVVQHRRPRRSHASGPKNRLQDAPAATPHHNIP